MKISTNDCLISTNNEGEICNVVYCEICGKPVLTPITKMPKHICENCSKSFERFNKGEQK